VRGDRRRDDFWEAEKQYRSMIEDMGMTICAIIVDNTTFLFRNYAASASFASTASCHQFENSPRLVTLRWHLPVLAVTLDPRSCLLENNA
jgi:hypothetical protein